MPPDEHSDGDEDYKMEDAEEKEEEEGGTFELPEVGSLLLAPGGPG
jgi:hypothetical protein